MSLHSRDPGPANAGRDDSYVGSAFRRTVIAAIVLAALAVVAIDAHKPITSPYTYTDDVFPILRDRCGRCHMQGGVAPMSLMTYKEAFPWGESIRTELIAGHMPPWTVEAPVGTFRNSQGVTARELNVLMTWATGGNPVGNPELSLPAVAPSHAWPLGPPDLVVPMAADFTIPADATERTEEFTLRVPAPASRPVRAVDLLPGNPMMVRSATISVKGPADSGDPRGVHSERVLAVWVPGDAPVPLDGSAALALPPNAELVLRIHYKKTWEHEREAMTDRSSVGVYFAGTAATRELRALTVSADSAAVVQEDLQALAIYPDSSLANVAVTVKATRPDNSQVVLIRFRPQPDWARRYWFSQPIVLPRGTRIDVSLAPDDLLPPGAPPIKSAAPSPARLTLNVASR